MQRSCPMRYTIAICCFLLILANQCRAWSEAGHIVIAELAQQSLPEETRKRLQEYANVLLAGAPENRESWLKRYPAYSVVSYTAAWPDTIRGITLEELFQHYGTRVPPELSLYRNKTTNNWHYTNRWYYTKVSYAKDSYAKQGYREQGVEIPEECRRMAYRFNNNGELLPVIERLYTGFKHSDSEAQRAVMLALLIHLISDLHQPLHNFAGVSDDCQHDRGGSGFCVVRRSPDSCELNLHRWWDSGVGLFESPVSLMRMEKWINGGKVGNAIFNNVSAEPIPARLEAWSDESREYTASVYALEEGTMPDSNYVDSAQAIVKKQTIVAVERLRAVLLTLID